ncbi:hypothetical protein SmJEL517_g03040 [Synchytrium microbalum]|uniref:DDE Tnp4 domain-containing protein n=1 Tax=Synchytrium microbalum TaxID=1806994 RepID=A0A507C8T6_9FUNG|nr:uncharacterized protein SmJEL517_g03040 [Synchytrium microbalum]TPX34384.1 hypothetical protein SmJEL517_g03040 [Synchytrium microbalum]
MDPYFALGYYEGFWQDEDEDDDGPALFMAVLMGSLSSRRVEAPDSRLILSNLSDSDCMKHFRFSLLQIEALVEALRMPTTLITDNRLRLSSVDALAIFLKRMVYPCRLVDLVRFFGREQSVISRFANHVSQFIHERWHNLLRWDRHRLTSDVLQSYSEAIWNKGGKLQGCFGFIDGTMRNIARPISNQEMVYNGWKRVHALKFQSVVAPDGLILHLDGPYLGKDHDAWVLHVTGLLDILEESLQFGDGRQFVLYGDPAYPVSDYIVRSFKAPHDPAHIRFNKMMSTVRIAVECGFGMIMSRWAFLDFEKNLNLLLQPVGQYYLVCGSQLHVVPTTPITTAHQSLEFRATVRAYEDDESANFNFERLLEHMKLTSLPTPLDRRKSGGYSINQEVPKKCFTHGSRNDDWL